MDRIRSPLLLLFLLCLLLLAPGLFGLPARSFAEPGAAVDESVPATVTLGEIIEYALKENPALRASGVGVEAASQRVHQARTLGDPVLTYSHGIDKIETRLGPANSSVTLMQKIPFPGKLSTKGSAAMVGVEIAKSERSSAERTLVARVKRLYYELYYIDKTTTLARENKAVLDYFVEVSRSNYSLNVSKLDELVRAERLRAASSLTIIRLEEERVSALARLRSALNIGLGQSLPFDLTRFESLTVPQFGYSVAELSIKASADTTLKTLGHKLARARINEKSAKYAYMPDFHLGVKYTDIGESPMAVTGSGRDALGVSVGVTLPIWRGGKRAGVAQARAEREQARLAVITAATEIDSKVHRLYQSVQSAAEVAHLYGDTLVPRAKESYEFAEARYRNGQEKLGRLLETQSMWIDFRRVYFSAVRDFFIAVSELERITGEELL
ncbi:MAG: TolC family protein [Proteobacteria bacterium]|nr:TolC family protein [Pseudomonadota bacterium]